MKIIAQRCTPLACYGRMLMVERQDERRIVHSIVSPYNSLIHTYKYFKNRNVDPEALCQASSMIGTTMGYYGLHRA
jgi:hypothetical protein